jgi:hypothetical protein
MKKAVCLVFLIQLAFLQCIEATDLRGYVSYTNSSEKLLKQLHDANNFG